MHKFTGADLDEMRGLIAMCEGRRMVLPGEQPFLADMKRRAAQSVMILTPKQYNWLLLIIDRVVTDQSLHGIRKA